LHYYHAHSDCRFLAGRLLASCTSLPVERSRRGRYLQDPAVNVLNPSRLENSLFGYDRTFGMAKDWSVTNRFAFFNNLYAQRITDFTSVNEITGLIQRNLWDVNTHRTFLSSNLDLNGKFETGPLNRAVLLGTDYYTETDHDFGVSNFFSSLPGLPPIVLPPINLFFPTAFPDMPNSR